MLPSDYKIMRPLRTYIQFIREGSITPPGHHMVFCTKYNIICMDEKGDSCRNGAFYIGCGIKTNYGYAYTRDQKLIRGDASRGIKKCPEIILKGLHWSSVKVRNVILAIDFI